MVIVLFSISITVLIEIIFCDSVKSPSITKRLDYAESFHADSSKQKSEAYLTGRIASAHIKTHLISLDLSRWSGICGAFFEIA
jgi:hypothetical protein